MKKHKLYSALLVFVVWAGSSQSGEYVGTKTCGGCHQAQYRLWQSSHHAQAMQPATPDMVLGDFKNVTFDYAGKTSRFYRKDGAFRVTTEGPDGKPADYRIDYTFGITPLQQYLIAFPDGRYQALSIAWDSRPEAEGGQRWFHLYPEQGIGHDDPLHWTGPYHNWNSRCAECHSTGLAKNYDVDTDSYNTTWREISVGCEACHGPGAEHLAWVKEGARGNDPGLPVPFAEPAHWQFNAPADTTKRAAGAAAAAEVDNSAGCHSRRAVLGEPKPGDAYLDGYRPELLQPPLYHADGQILDEVYVAGSFWQSKMFHAGVRCSSCHEPHSGQLRGEGNAVCHQCHKAAVFDAAAHHHHPRDSDGARCANCHMPERTYMVVDDRRDHSIRVPDPWLSREFNTPNACNQCHRDKSPGWAVAALSQWGVAAPPAQRFTRLLALANSGGQPQAVKLLADDSTVPAIARSTALAQMDPSRQSHRAALENALAAPLLRLGAVSAFEQATPELRLTLLWPLLDDSTKAVRLEATRLLSAVPHAQLSPDQKKRYERALRDYTQAQQLDFGGSWLNLAQIHINRGDHQRAEVAYQRALKLEPQLVPALINLADLYRALERDTEAQPLLEKALAIAPDSAAAQFAYGLWLVRDKQYQVAIEHLARAADLAPEVARYAYVYAVALQSVGQVEEARAVASRALARHPEHAGLRQLRETLNRAGR